MDRHLSVNAEYEFAEPSPWSGGPDEILRPAPQGLLDPGPTRPAAPSSRPCLYIGPSGQRCDRPATRGDFCSQHTAPISNISEPGAAVPDNSKLIKRAVALGSLVIALWPFIVDLIRALRRILH